MKTQEWCTHSVRSSRIRPYQDRSPSAATPSEGRVATFFWSALNFLGYTWLRRLAKAGATSPMP